jgi:hypothetical protein
MAALMKRLPTLMYLDDIYKDLLHKIPAPIIDDALSRRGYTEKYNENQLCTAAKVRKGGHKDLQVRILKNIHAKV